MSESQGLTAMCEHFYPYVLRYAHQFSQEPDDLTQDVMVKAIKAWTPAMEAWSRGQMANWLKQVTRTTAYDMTKRAQVREPYSDEVPADGVPGGEFEQSVVDRESIKLAWARLGERPRKTLLYRIAGFSSRTIMQREHITAPAVYDRIHYAQEMLRRELERVA